MSGSHAWSAGFAQMRRIDAQPDSAKHATELSATHFLRGTMRVIERMTVSAREDDRVQQTRWTTVTQMAALHTLDLGNCAQISDSDVSQTVRSNIGIAQAEGGSSTH